MRMTSNYFSAEIEFFSLIEEQNGESTFKADLTNLVLPNNMFINGISLFLNDTSSCQEKDFETCSDNDVECETAFVPDPRQYNLTDDYIYVELEWGSLFYKHIGNTTKSMAKFLCSREGTHLPTPRFDDENEFYKTHFGDDGLWLDVTFDAKKGLKSANGHWYIKYLRTFTDRVDQPDFARDIMTGDEKFAQIKYDEWISLTERNPGSVAGLRDFNEWTEKDVFMTYTGVWEWAEENNSFNAICVYNIIPDENCSKCQNESACKFDKREEKEIECVCRKMTEGEFCETDLCSHCKNGGYCDENKCICPYPFHGRNCEGRCQVFTYIQNIFQIRRFYL